MYPVRAAIESGSRMPRYLASQDIKQRPSRGIIVPGLPSYHLAHSVHQCLVKYPTGLPSEINRFNSTLERFRTPTDPSGVS
jgi:hypothetical protein